MRPPIVINADPTTLAELTQTLKQKAQEFGFRKLGVSPINLARDEAYLERWLALNRHGEMSYMARHGTRRTRPDELLPGTVRVLAACMDYLPEPGAHLERALAQPGRAYIARYALGRDYHKLLRKRLQRLASWLGEQIADTRYRVFVDSAPVLERALARNAGLGWIGKHTNLLDRHAGSWFLLGEIYTNLPLPCDEPVSDHCGSCTACIDICPTRAIVGPQELDARRCISYLTIEQKGSIPIEFRRAIGNRIFGCDDCQIVCPWNRYASLTREADFRPRHGLDNISLVELFGWSETEWRDKTTGSPLRRPGFNGWRRNIAVALGNAPGTPDVIAALAAAADDPSELVREHVHWALAQHGRGHGRQSVADADIVDQARASKPGGRQHD